MSFSRRLGQSTAIRRTAALFVLGSSALVGCRAKREQVAPSVVIAAPPPSAPVAPRDAPPSPPACAPIASAKVAAFPVDRSKIDVAVPPILDAKEAMGPFYERVAELARGRSQRHVRIAVYGDSNLTEDRLTGQMRRALQERFGDGGHGYVALARPWAWYVHQDVHHHGTWPLFRQIAVTTDPIHDKQYGMNNFAAESHTRGAAVWVSTADASARVGRTAKRFELSFLKQPRGGSFEILLDEQPVRTVSTLGEAFAPGYETIETEDGPHALKCVVKGDGPVRFFGATLERDPIAVQVDSLGCGSLNFQRMLMVDDALRRDQLAHRHYDLVVVWLGMNSMWLEPNRQWVKDVVAALRGAIPGLPVLLVTPPDSVKEGESKSDPRIEKLAKQIREVAAETGAAFWDMREAMGGPASFVTFMRKRLASPDRHHLLAEGAELMGDRLLSAMWTGLGTYLDKHPEAGCASN